MLDGGVVFVDVSDAETEGLNMNVDMSNSNGMLALASKLMMANNNMHANGAGHEYIYEEIMGALSVLKGDVDLDGDVDVDDVLALLWHVLFPTDYPIEVDADFDRNEDTDVDDVIWILTISPS